MLSNWSTGFSGGWWSCNIGRSSSIMYREPESSSRKTLQNFHFWRHSSVVHGIHAQGLVACGQALRLCKILYRLTIQSTSFVMFGSTSVYATGEQPLFRFLETESSLLLPMTGFTSCSDRLSYFISVFTSEKAWCAWAAATHPSWKCEYLLCNGSLM